MVTHPVHGDGIVLRAFQPGDADDLVTACNDPLVRRYLPRLPSPYTHEHAVGWIGSGALAAFAAGGAAFAVADPASDRLLGGAGLDRPLPERQQAEVGYWTAPWARGRKVATAALRTLADWAFSRADLARLELLTDWTNTASQRVADAAGFRREGVRRGAAPAVDGADRLDLLVFARLAGDPPGPVARVLPDLPGGELSDGVVTLRPMTADDAGFLQQLYSVRDVAATSVPPGPPQPWETSQRSARAAARWLAGERAELIVCDAATGAPAGEIQLCWRDPARTEATVGYSLLPERRGRGWATLAMQLVALWTFAETGTGRLVAASLPQNEASHRVLIRAGFRREGTLRSGLRAADGTRVDGIQYALVADDLLDAVTRN